MKWQNKSLQPQNNRNRNYCIFVKLTFRNKDCNTINISTFIKTNSKFIKLTKSNLATAKNVLNISFTRSSHSRSNITTHDLYFARVSKMTTLLPNDGPLVSLNPLKVLTIKRKISCKQIQQQPGLSTSTQKNKIKKFIWKCTTNFVKTVSLIKDMHL